MGLESSKQLYPDGFRGLPQLPDNRRRFQKVQGDPAIPTRRVIYDEISVTESWTPAGPFLVKEQGTTREWLLHAINSFLDAPLRAQGATVIYGEGNAKSHTGIFPNLRETIFKETTALQLLDTLTITPSDLKLLGKYKKRRKRGDKSHLVDSLKQRIIYFAKLIPRERPNDLIDRLYKIIGELLDSSVLLA